MSFDIIAALIQILHFLGLIGIGIIVFYAIKTYKILKSIEVKVNLNNSRK